MEYHISYEDLDKHWIVSCTHEKNECAKYEELFPAHKGYKIIMRFPSRDQAESFVENRINFIGDGENNFENNA